MTQCVTVDVISDLHLGEGSHDPAALGAYTAFAKVHRPDVRVWLGDIAEVSSCSSHGGEANPPTLLEDIQATQAGIASVIGPAPADREIWVPGNHEDRYSRRIIDSVPEMAEALPSLEELLNLGEWGFEIPGTSWTLGSVLFTHGFVSSRHHGPLMLNHFPGYSVVYGHHHTSRATWQRPSRKAPQPLDPSAHTHKNRVAIANPCMRDMHPTWVKGPVTWCQGFTRMVFWGPEQVHFSFQSHIMQGPTKAFWAEGQEWGSP